MYLQISYFAEVERGLCSLQQRIEFVKAHVVWFHPLWWITVLLLPKNVYFSVKGFHSDLSIDDRSLINLGPHLHIWKQCDVISNVGWNGWPIFDEWKISDLELESEVGSEEVEVAISGRNVGRGRSWGETSTAGQGWGVGVKIPFCSVIIELLTFCRSGTG